MSIRFAVLALIAFLVVPIIGQSPTGTQAGARSASAVDPSIPTYIKEETPEQRKARLGTAEDPGIDPDPEKMWWRFGHAYKIEKYDRKWAAYDQPPGFVRPFAMANFGFEIYQQNEQYVWVWMPQIDEAIKAGVITRDAPAEKVTPYTEPQIAYLRMIAPEYEPLSVPSASKTIRFEQASTGLPQQGSWRNSLAVADMNGDGHADIIAPPERGSGTIPAIFLGDSKGNWTPWTQVIWPYEIQYGSVAAADFNNDKKMDLVFGIHLVGLRVFIGDGKGNFTDSSRGMEDVDFTTRRVRTSDVDLDGDTDIVAIYEGPAPAREGRKFTGGRLRVYINEKNGTVWKPTDISAPRDYVGGDWVAMGKFNNDRFPDFVASSNYFQATDLLYRSTGRGKWSKVDARDGELIPFLSIYTAVATGRFTTGRFDDAVISYQRSWPERIDSSIVKTPSLAMVTGLDRITFEGDQPRRIPLVRYGSAGMITGLSTGDFDGDGNRDLIYTKFDPREFVILLGDGRGGFRQASIEGLPAEDKPTYDINVADVNKDGRPDVLIMYESNAVSSLGRQDGSVKVFLNRGTSRTPSVTADARE